MHPLTSVHYNHSPGNGMFNSVHKSLPSLYPNLAPAKNNLNLSAPSAPEEPSPAYHEVHNPPWVRSKISPSSADITDARDGEGSSSSNESNSTSTEVQRPLQFSLSNASAPTRGLPVQLKALASYVVNQILSCAKKSHCHMHNNFYKLMYQANSQSSSSWTMFSIKFTCFKNLLLSGVEVCRTSIPV